MNHGRHVKILGNGNPQLLRSLTGLQGMLEDLVAQLGMRCLDQPHLYDVEEEIHKIGVEPFEDEGGLTGVAVLSTSHCAVHTWPARSYFVMDVYSCRDFDPKRVQQLVSQHLQATNIKLTDLSHSLVPDPQAVSGVLRAPVQA